MTSIEPERWVERARDAIAFYEAAFGATVLHRVEDGDEVVAQLAVGEARYWISSASATRPSPRANRGATGRVLLVAAARARRESTASAAWRVGLAHGSRRPSGCRWYTTREAISRSTAPAPSAPPRSSSRDSTTSTGHRCS